jgi:hypothetical protein
MATSYCLVWDSPTWKARSSCLYPPGTRWPSYTHGQWVLFFVACPCQSQRQCHITTDGRSVSMSWYRTHSGICDQLLLSVRRLLSESFCLVSVRCPLWREVGSVICQSQSVVRVRIRVILRTTVSLSVRLGVGPLSGQMIILQISLCDKSFFFHIGHPFWRENGSVICQSQSVVRVRVILRTTVSLSVRLGVGTLSGQMIILQISLCDKIFFVSYRAPFLTRERVCNLQWNRAQVTVAQDPQPYEYSAVSFENTPTWRAISPHSPSPGTGRPSYTPRHWDPPSSPLTTRRATGSPSSSSSYTATDGQSVRLSWCRAPYGVHDQILIFFVGQL